jgi:hypothetical protein
MRRAPGPEEEVRLKYTIQEKWKMLDELQQNNREETEKRRVGKIHL